MYLNFKLFQRHTFSYGITQGNNQRCGVIATDLLMPSRPSLISTSRADLLSPTLPLSHSCSAILASPLSPKVSSVCSCFRELALAVLPHLEKTLPQKSYSCVQMSLASLYKMTVSLHCLILCGGHYAKMVFTIPMSWCMRACVPPELCKWWISLLWLGCSIAQRIVTEGRLSGWTWLLSMWVL